ncbi:MAG: hypothetical protein ACO4AY_06335 [Ilumatobacteraceae bacterium]
MSSATQSGRTSPSGDAIVRADLVMTALFAVSASCAAAWFTTTWQWVGAIVAMSLFAVGVFVFLWSYWSAVQRSRTAEIAVTQLYLLMGDAVPAPVRRTMNLVLVGQFLIATATTFVRPDGPDGSPGSSLALGFLVPMLGFGLNGLWAVRHGNFAARADLGADRSLHVSEGEIGQNADHG